MYMKNKLALLLFFILTGVVSVDAQNLPDQKETLEIMKKVNGYFMKKYADYTIRRKRSCCARHRRSQRK